MADVTTLLRASTLNPEIKTGGFIDTIRAAISATEADNGDRIQLATITQDMRLFDSRMRVDGTLGAATVQLQRDRAGVYTNLTGATTAGGADAEEGISGAIDLDVDDKIVLLVGTADISAAANAEVDLHVQRR